MKQKISAITFGITISIYHFLFNAFDLREDLDNLIFKSHRRPILEPGLLKIPFNSSVDGSARVLSAVFEESEAIHLLKR